MWGSYGEYCDIEDMLGKTITRIEQNGNDELVFHTEEGKYRMYHSQDCCESVWLEEIIGDIEDLVGSPITMAECVSQAGPEDSWCSSTWTFYKLATNKGYVTLRWLGESNGYYSESVDFEFIPNEKIEEELDF